MNNTLKKKRLASVNRALQQWFTTRGLDLDAVWRPTLRDLELQNYQLSNLQAWVLAYEIESDREVLEDQGFAFPPIDPSRDIDSDWYRFERWMRGEPLRWSYAEAFGELPKVTELSSEQIEHRLEQITSNLKSRNVLVELQDGVPPKLVYAYLESCLAEERFSYGGPSSFWIIDGCDGHCPACFQRSWCEHGRALHWPTEGEFEPFLSDEWNPNNRQDAA